ncbi:hypothetical protein COLO4_18758 [Corchorus olitorius]|uniref:Uncharacterized protein n=1 Tax=Corchorus olitorius TaxID=93759 RepID=A0A1R3J7X8_9ROSI|nr:hypothetical protein COLO4_18758 [Corchorus olitorius]
MEEYLPHHHQKSWRNRLSSFDSTIKIFMNNGIERKYSGSNEKANTTPLSIKADISCPHHLHIKLSPMPDTIPPGVQVQCLLEIEIYWAEGSKPFVYFSYYKFEDKDVDFQFDLPVAFNKFLQQKTVAKDLDSIWESLTDPSLRLELDFLIARSMPISAMANLLNGMRIMTYPVLIKIEIFPEIRSRLRVTVASKDTKVG